MTPSNQEAERCHYCKQFYHAPVGHHHDDTECRENQIASLRSRVSALEKAGDEMARCCEVSENHGFAREWRALRGKGGEA